MNLNEVLSDDNQKKYVLKNILNKADNTNNQSLLDFFTDYKNRSKAMNSKQMKNLLKRFEDILPNEILKLSDIILVYLEK